LTLIMHELDNATRQIYTDGRPHPEVTKVVQTPGVG